MTPAVLSRLKEIRAREQAATPGEWVHPDAWDGTSSREVWTRGGVQVAARLSPADAEFIAHAREDLPFLLAQIEAQGWQPIADLPNEWTDGRDVLVLNGAQPRVAQWQQGDWRYGRCRNGGMLTCLDVTHFAPLPSPPPDGSEQ